MSHCTEDFEKFALELAEEYDDCIENLHKELTSLMEDREREGKEFHDALCELDGLLGENLDKEEHRVWKGIKLFLDAGEEIDKTLRETRRMLKHISSLKNYLNIYYFNNSEKEENV